MSTNTAFRIAILADDLTSASDGAGPFVARGLSAVVGRQAVPAGAARVRAVDIASRSMTAAQAACRMEAVAAELRATDLLFKTVDSTLRGHVQIEIAAALRGSRRARLVFAPAFPEMNRTTKGGVQLVDGIPVHLSSYGRDPVHPARTASLADLVPAEADQVTLLDALTQADLDRQVAEFDHPEQILWVGSPGLARALARRTAAEAQPRAAPVQLDGRLLVVIGSANALSHRQAEAIRDWDNVTVLSAPAARQEDPASVLEALVSDATRLLREGSFGALIATGGDTMDAILDQLGVDQFDLLGEIESGFPIGRAHLAERTLLLGMKAGGFGNAETLRHAAHRLTRHAREVEA